MLHRACRLARRWSGNVLPNPIEDTELPTWTLDECPSKVRAPERWEVTALLDAALIEDLGVAVSLRLLAGTGLRRGEACALRWSAINVEAATLRVDEAVVVAKGGAVVPGPKTRSSVRTLAVDAATLGGIETLRARQIHLASTCGLLVAPDAFVFSFEPGGTLPPYPDSLQSIADAAGVPGSTLARSWIVERFKKKRSVSSMRRPNCGPPNDTSLTYSATYATRRPRATDSDNARSRRLETVRSRVGPERYGRSARAVTVRSPGRSVAVLG